MERVLIANRGEIALRVIRACKELGLETVAIYSEADRESLHVRFADAEVCVGPPPATESYLHVPRIIAAAEITGADAVHPGYGFLAENPEFAEICAQSGLTFVGPPAEVIRTMGDKAAARSLLAQEGIPVVPGSDGPVETEEEARQVAETVGYPVLIKAASGGGGRGMRAVREPDGLPQAFQVAQAEAERAFKDPRVYIEQYLAHPRHVEIQVFADRHGRVVHLGERECSIQRRHQKLLEESPSPAVSEELREAMGETAVRTATAIGYVGAGTVEFLLDAQGRFFFMEMNTRIQVEHPVTEMVTGRDLVKEQLRVAAGERLGFRQEEIEFRGHAIECRINAEDPERDFLPTPGIVTSFHQPGGPGIRVDTHVYASYEIVPYYDSLIAKVIAHGRDRDEAIVKMRSALDEFVVEGITTTIPFHAKLLDETDFRRGIFDVQFLERRLQEHGPVLEEVQQ